MELTQDVPKHQEMIVEESDLPSEVNQLESVAAQSCLEMDFSTDSVSKAIDTFYQRNGDYNFKAKDLCEILLEEEEHDKCVPDKAEITTISVQPTDGHDMDHADLSYIMFDECQMCKMCDIDHLTFIAYHHLYNCHQCFMFQSTPLSYHLHDYSERI
ncbi:uncharacterized protein LOC132750823 isoform X1 [Ruditapes philippinarum]|uniref:uncharacterized protein LOC132750823 isoform X1 n=1 Tax=Ruditapes philippinarum TaxID=129788 RepID=UPI00295BD871|nr:uncharacterized protein LOC132750823 isoform X1 [Ruditapes philippinarum]